MTESLLVALIFLPVILAALASVLCWRLVSRRVLFLVTSTLSLVGLQAVFAPVTSAFLPQGAEISAAMTNEAFTQSVIVAAAFQLTAGIAFLWWLYRAFRKP